MQIYIFTTIQIILCLLIWKNTGINPDPTFPSIPFYTQIATPVPCTTILITYFFYKKKKNKISKLTLSISSLTILALGGITLIILLTPKDYVFQGLNTMGHHAAIWIIGLITLLRFSEEAK